MKPSATNFSTSTTGLGRRLDTPSDEWFMARVTAASTSGGHNIYSLTEIEPDTTGFGYRDKDGGLTLTGVWELNDLSVAVGTRVMARFRAWNTTEGATYEIYSGSSSSGINYFSNQRIAPYDYVIGPTIGPGQTCKGVVSCGIQVVSYTRQFTTVRTRAKLGPTGLSHTNNLVNVGNAVGYYQLDSPSSLLFIEVESTITFSITNDEPFQSFNLTFMADQMETVNAYCIISTAQGFYEIT